MRKNIFTLVFLTSALLAGCGGGSRDQAPKIKFSAQVAFGDSLSDIGTYAVGGVKTLGGGKYTVNDIGADGKNAARTWTELMATQFGLQAPCPAETGLLSNGLLANFAAAISFAPSCTSYAQGGARVTGAVGPANVAYVDKHRTSQLGQLTVPIVTQIANHLAKGGGRFKGDEIVFVLAGGNDLFYQANQLVLDATAAGNAAAISTLIGALAGSADPTQGPVFAAAVAAMQAAAASAIANNGDVTAAIVTVAMAPPYLVSEANIILASGKATDAGTAAGAAYASDPVNLSKYIAEMAMAGDQLAALVTGQIILNGANFVTVLNLPDASKTPDVLTQSAGVQAWFSAMVAAFNEHLASGLAGQSKVLLVDAHALDHDQAINPVPYGFSNVTQPVCADVDRDTPLTPPKNVLHSSLVCNKDNLIAGADQHYKFADGSHPTPFTHLLLARYVSTKLIARGWL